MKTILRNSLAVLLISGCGGLGTQALLSASSAPLNAASAGTFRAVAFQGHTYKLFVPSQAASGAQLPLVLALHGCSQDPDSFAAATQFNAVAEQQGLYVLYPEQTSDQNALECWNWFDPADQQRGTGDPALFVAEIQQVESQYRIDASRVYVAGFSAGGAMANVMGATYPDVFAAVSANSGLEYQAATNATAAWTAMTLGGPAAAEPARAAYQAMGPYRRVVPTIIFHGTADYTVNELNADEETEQWLKTDEMAGSGNLSRQSGEGTAHGGGSFTDTRYTDTRGQVIVEQVLVDDMGHAWSGGSASAQFTYPAGPAATERSWAFFSAHPM